MMDEILNALQFVPYAAGAGLIISLLDYLTTLVHEKKKSVFGLQYGGRNTLKYMGIWTLGAAAAGFLGFILKIFQPTMASAITAAILWPILIERITKMVQANEPEQEPVQGVDGEEEV
jgi:hypothetical protein